MFQKKGVGMRRLKYRLPENHGILNSRVRGNGLVEGHTYVNHMLDEPSHIFPNLGSDCDCDFRFKKSIIDDQIAEMASLNFTALELSLFSRKKQRSKKIKTLYNCI